jgi:hypothetical protein
MKKIFFIYLTLTTIVFGYNYDDVILKAQASIFPKVLLLDKRIESKLINGKIVYTIIYDDSDYLTALSIEKLINKNFKGQLDKYEYSVNLIDYRNFTDKIATSAIYVLNLNKHIKKIAKIANEKGIISFSYDINNLKKGLMFSLVIEKYTILYLKREILLIEKIEFVDALLQMVKFVEKDYAYEDDIQYQNKLNLKSYYASLFYNQKNDLD